MSNLSDLLNGQPVSARQAAAEAERRGIKLPYGTIAAYWSGKHGRPSAGTLEKLAAVLPLSLGQLQRAAWDAETNLGEYRPPREADLLNSRQRRALDELIRSIVAAKGATDEDQDTQDPQGDPPVDGETGTRRAPMKGADIAWLEDHRAPDVDDMLDRVTAEARRQEEADGEREEPLPYEPQEVHAARDIDGPTQGELRRRPGKDAGEENQDPGDDWGGA